MNTYRVVVTRESNAWLADVPEVQGAHTFARNLARLDIYVREVIAAMLDLPEGAEADLSVAYEYDTGDAGLDAQAAELRAARARHDADARAIEQSTAAMAVAYTRRFPVRDTAAILGVSPGRISQIAPKDNRKAAA